MRKHKRGLSTLVLFGMVGLAWAATNASTASTNNSTSGSAVSPGSRMKTITNAQRRAAAAKARANRTALRAAAKQAAKTRLSTPVNAGSLSPKLPASGVATVAPAPTAKKAAAALASTAASTATPLTSGAAIAAWPTPIGIPGGIADGQVCAPGILDYFNCGNYANSPLPEPQIDPATNQPVVDANGYFVPKPGTGIRKFVDTLAGIGAANANGLGNYIPVATPGHATLADGTVDRAADYYEIQVDRYTQQVHSDLPPTLFQGYKDASSAVGSDASHHYLGPIIFAQRDVPVRVKFTNNLPIGADGYSFLPVDKSMKGAGTGPDGSTYTENRALLHLHGGITPWISDGTPHQWITPANESTTLKKGASQKNVPDMVQPAADGSGGWDTWYYTNQQSARMLWYHDHSYAMTRHNVYAGEAAPYIISDKWEDDLIDGTNNTGTNSSLLKLLPDGAGLNKNSALAIPAGSTTTTNLYRHGIPMVIQDKTFVPPTVDTTGKLPGNYTMDQLMAEDPTWFNVIPNKDSAHSDIWGQYGQLWFPHVFMPNQNPNDPNTVVNGYGRWDYGAWVWPPVTGLTHPPNTGAIDPVSGATITIPPFPNPSAVQEAFMDTPVVNGTAYPTMTVGNKAYRFRVLNASNDRHWNLQFYYATDAQGNVCNPNAANASTAGAAGCTEVKMITASRPLSMKACPANTDVHYAVQHSCYPATWPTDGRDGGVPDYNTVGPDIIQIGSDSGFLPAPVVIPSQAVNYEYNRRVITALNISEHALLLGPAERADIVVDFSNVPDGAVLIMYNDAPAPNPGFDTRIDYFTGDTDASDSGGAPTTIPGYGPNTRTVMQFVVNSGADPGTAPFDIAALTSVMKGVYSAEQKAPLVPAAAYGASSNVYAKIQDVTFDVTKNTFVDSAGAANTGTDQVINLQPKSIAEEFDTDWGRMTAQLGVELPFSNFLTQTTLQMWMFDPPTEITDNNQVQIWRVTHNGVDTHSVHFHMFDVQLINRVAWDGTMYPPDANELGWKETVRMNPLTDAIIALRPITPTLPFSLPDSYRVLDPTSPKDSTAPAFTNVDPITNNPITVTNQLTNFGWEYVWHCHLLGHEENDMMRPIVVEVKPEVPTGLTASRASNNSVNLSWANTAASATGFNIQRATDAAFTQNVVTLGTTQLGGSTYTIPPTVSETSQLAVGAPRTYNDATGSPVVQYYYRVASTKLFNDPVESNGPLSSDWSTAVTLAPLTSSLKISPSSLAFGVTTVGRSSNPQLVTLSNTGTADITGLTLSTTGDFTAQPACFNNRVTAHSSCTILVRFAPKATGVRNGTLTISSSDPAGPQTVTLVGGVSPAITVAPVGPLAFTSQLNTTTAAQTFTVTSSGNYPVTISSVTLGGAAANQYAQKNTCPATLIQGATCTVSVTFTPTSAGAKNASVTVNVAAPANSIAVSLNGTPILPVSVTPTSLSFGTVNRGTTSAPQNVTVTNTGSTAATLSLNLSFGFLSSNQFAYTNNCGASVAAGSSCTIAVTFKPASGLGGFGPKSGTLAINVGGQGVSNVTLTGTGR
jgi:FtsP/CotA-like multicopper oxidase with cupredoxin domain